LEEREAKKGEEKFKVHLRAEELDKMRIQAEERL